MGILFQSGRKDSMEITVSNEICVENPTTEIIYWCKMNLVIANPEYHKKLRMGLWLGKTPAELYLYRKNGTKYFIPYGSWTELKKLVSVDTKITYDFADNGTVNYNTKLPLYDYQQKAEAVLLKHSNGILQAPCGSGKTQVGVSLAVEIGKKTLWLTHTKDLLTQSKERAAEYIDRSLLGTITEGKVNISEGITFATVQTMANLDLPLYKYTWDVLIVDECHRVCISPNSITMFSKVINNLATKRKYGLSATVHREDGLIKSTFALLGGIICAVPDSAVADKTIDVLVQEVNTFIKMSDSCLDTDGTIIYSELIKYLVENRERTRLIASKIAEHKDHSNLIMSDRLQHLRDIIESLVDHGIDRNQIRMISGDMTSKTAKAERTQALDDMRVGKARFLLATYNLAKEGLDIPVLDRVFLTIPKKNFNGITQSIGRIERTADGKFDAICYDFVDNIGFCEGSWRKRKAIYKKKGCVILECAEIPTQKSLFGFAA